MAEVVAEIPQAIEDAERTVTEENMDVEPKEEAVPDSNISEHNNANGVDRNGDAKRSREDEEEKDNGTDGENGVSTKKQKVEKSVEEERLEKLQESEEKEEEGVQQEGGGEEDGKSEAVSLGPKKFSSSVEMFDYFFKFLHSWPPNIDINKYEYLVLLDLLKKGHLESDKKIGTGVSAFQVRYHPMWKSRCFFILRQDDSVEDFSFRKCVDHILPLPEEMKIKSDANKVLGGRGGRGGGGRGGRGGGGRRGGHGRGRGGR